MTAAGHTVLETDLKHRQQVERPRIIQQITEARTHGDLSENAEYHAAKEQQSINEGAIAEPEADAKKGRISITSPLARALINKKKGETVEVVTPGGAKAYEITKIEWK